MPINLQLPQALTEEALRGQGQEAKLYKPRGCPLSPVPSNPSPRELPSCNP